MMALAALGEAGAAPDQNWLQVEDLGPVEPLDAQFGVHPKKSAPDALRDALFGQPAPSDAEREAFGQDIPPLATYAVLDATKMPYLLTSLLESSGLRYQSLFQGEAQEELGEHAPYLVELKDGHDFTRRLFTGPDGIGGLWEKELGIFIRSRAGFDALRKHLRKFTRVQDETGKWFYFRFWEGGPLGEYLKEHHEDAKAYVQQFIGTQTFILVSQLASCAQAFSAPVPLSTLPDKQRGGWPHLLQDFQAIQLKKFKRNLADSLRQSFQPFGELDPDQGQSMLHPIVDHALAFGLDDEEAVENYCKLCLIIGQPPENFEDLRKILKGPQHQIDRTKKALQLVNEKLAK
ncbi:DUF4123 domain-containing protein [Roseinatronobacter monicus]|nr:DUF4123 domain-containing protein [Roseinatronobacter monicus]